MQRAEIRVEGHLNTKWAEWFDDFELTYTGAGDTLLSGYVQDQAAFYGLIAKLRDLGVKLIAVEINLPDDSITKTRHFDQGNLEPGPTRRK